MKATPEQIAQVNKAIDEMMCHVRAILAPYSNEELFDMLARGENPLLDNEAVDKK